MKVECTYNSMVKLSELKPHPKNRNIHPKDQIERLAKILEYQGWRYPIKVSNLSGFVTSGHGRIEAAKLNGWTTAPVNFQDYADETMEYSDVIADNSIASWAELDLSAINIDLPEFGPELDIDLLGIKDFVLDLSEKNALDDSVPEMPKEAKSKLGELWLLGAYYECDLCHKQYEYEIGRKMDVCPCQS